MQNLLSIAGGFAERVRLGGGQHDLARDLPNERDIALGRETCRPAEGDGYDSDEDFGDAEDVIKERRKTRLSPAAEELLACTPAGRRLATFDPAAADECYIGPESLWPGAVNQWSPRATWVLQQWRLPLNSFLFIVETIPTIRH